MYTHREIVAQGVVQDHQVQTVQMERQVIKGDVVEEDLKVQKGLKGKQEYVVLVPVD